MTNKITYTQQGDYLLPDLKLPEQPKVEIGIWGRGSPVETSAAGRSADRADRRDLGVRAPSVPERKSTTACSAFSLSNDDPDRFLIF